MPHPKGAILNERDRALLSYVGIAVQRALGHSSPEITAAIYDHSDLEDYRADVERALSFAPTARVNAPVMQGAGSGKNEGRDGFGIPSDVAAFSESGRQDLNLRPLGPEPSALPG